MADRRMSSAEYARRIRHAELRAERRALVRVTLAAGVLLAILLACLHIASAS